ncbi:MAG: zinc ribbon domain-containing protein [Actinobacteria bacterium]|nr:zinc ribbon domain-containing protein [Actinomycetota bacterium]
MPIYEYRCLKCNCKFEKLVIKEEKVVCPHCESDDVKKLISSFSSPNAASGSACASCTVSSCSGCGSSN